jgi:hypothetical protein
MGKNISEFRADELGIRPRPFLENIFLEKFLEKNNFLEKFLRNSRNNNRNSNQVFYTFGILVKCLLKFKQNWHLLKLMMKYYQKLAEFGKIWGKTCQQTLKT